MTARSWDASFFASIRAWTISSWRHGDRIAAARGALAALAVSAAAADGVPRPTVPDAGVHALADQLAVLTDDARQAGVAPAAIEQILTELAHRLGRPPPVPTATR